MNIIDLLQYQFIQRAFIAGVVVAVTCAVLGVFLVLRKMSLIGDGLAHVSFGAVAIGLVLGVLPLFVALPLVILASLGIQKLQDKARVYGDSAIGMVSVTGLAIGVLVASQSQGLTVDIMSYLFGSILAISAVEVWLSIVVSIIVLASIFILYRPLFAITFDSQYARVMGINVDRINSFLLILTGVSVVLAIKVVGVLLVSALLIIPAVTAIQLARGFAKTLALSAMFATFSVALGLLLSIQFNLPAGPTIVLTNVVVFGVILVWGNLVGK